MLRELRSLQDSHRDLLANSTQLNANLGLLEQYIAKLSHQITLLTDKLARLQEDGPGSERYRAADVSVIPTHWLYSLTI